MPYWLSQEFRDDAREQERQAQYAARHVNLPWKATLFNLLWSLHKRFGELPFPSDISECRDNCVVLLWSGAHHFYMSFPKELGDDNYTLFTHKGFFDPLMACGVYNESDLTGTVVRDNFVYNRAYCIDRLDDLVYGKQGRLKIMMGGVGCRYPWCHNVF